LQKLSFKSKCRNEFFLLCYLQTIEFLTTFLCPGRPNENGSATPESTAIDPDRTELSPRIVVQYYPPSIIIWLFWLAPTIAFAQTALTGIIEQDHRS
tara:strand:- start:550 stop:840 length:291 start_codon:yes stop_codon:yes gene_type:complete